jgi:hypothetical protein
VPYISDLLAHMRAVSHCLPRFQARAEFNVSTFRLEVHARGRYYEFVPQYIVLKDGRIRYNTYLTLDATGFLGWLPYFNKRWELAIDKLAFKRYCLAGGLRTPRFSHDTHVPDTGVIVKHRALGFGDGIRGPFRHLREEDAEHALRDGEFYEEFIVGDIAKIWYWEGQVVCVESKPMPRVVGDGKLCVKDLMERCIKSQVLLHNSWSVQEAFARFQGLSLDSIPDEGAVVLADFRYNSAMNPIALTNPNVADKYRGTHIGMQLAHAGSILWNGIPPELRKHVLYSVDAIVDSQQQVWFLEMNCNPVTPPDTYFPMFESLFGKAADLPPSSGRGPGMAGLTSLSPPQMVQSVLS